MRGSIYLLPLLAGCVAGPGLDGSPVEGGPWLYTGDAARVLNPVDVYVGDESIQSDASGVWELESDRGPHQRVDAIFDGQSHTYVDCERHHEPQFESSGWGPSDSTEEFHFDLRLVGFDPALALRGVMAIEGQEGADWQVDFVPRQIDDEHWLQLNSLPGGAWSLHVWQQEGTTILRDAALSGESSDGGSVVSGDLELEPRDYGSVTIDADFSIQGDEGAVAEVRQIGDDVAYAVVYHGVMPPSGPIPRLGWGDELNLAVFLPPTGDCTQTLSRWQRAPIDGDVAVFGPWLGLPGFTLPNELWSTAPTVQVHLPDGADRFELSMSRGNDVTWQIDGSEACGSDPVAYPDGAQAFEGTEDLRVLLRAKSDTQTVLCQSRSVF
jgi:hypothetical protein